MANLCSVVGSTEYRRIGILGEDAVHSDSIAVAGVPIDEPVGEGGRTPRLPQKFGLPFCDF